MTRINPSKVFLFIGLLALSLVPQSESKPKKGRKTALGIGLLGGAAASMAISHALQHSNAPAPVATVHHVYSPPLDVKLSPVVIPAPVQVVHSKTRAVPVIENSPRDANGCYRQTKRQAHPQNRNVYIETVQLICPTIKQYNVAGTPNVIASLGVVPVQQQPHQMIVQYPVNGAVLPPYAPVIASNAHHIVIMSNRTLPLPPGLVLGLAPSLTIPKGCLAILVIFYGFMTFFL